MRDQCVVEVKGPYIPTEDFLRLNMQLLLYDGGLKNTGIYLSLRMPSICGQLKCNEVKFTCQHCLIAVSQQTCLQLLYTLHMKSRPTVQHDCIGLALRRSTIINSMAMPHCYVDSTLYSRLGLQGYNLEYYDYSIDIV